MDQLDKKRKAVMDQKEKGEKILKDPKAPKFLHSHMDKLNALWSDANKSAESRLKQLKGANFPMMTHIQTESTLRKRISSTHLLFQTTWCRGSVTSASAMRFATS